MILEDGLTYHNSKVTLTKKWQRFSFQAFTSAGQHRFKIGTFGPQGLVTNVTSTIYVWGAQVEQGVLRSTYYSTQGSALTRNQNKLT